MLEFEEKSSFSDIFGFSFLLDRDMKLETNRGNFLLLKMLKYRFPNIFKEPQVEFVKKMLSQSLDQTDSSE